MRYTHEQGLVKRRGNFEEMFHPSTLKHRHPARLRGEVEFDEVYPDIDELPKEDRNGAVLNPQNYAGIEYNQSPSKLCSLETQVDCLC